MANAALEGTLHAGNSQPRFDEENGFLAKPRRAALLCKVSVWILLAGVGGVCAGGPLDAVKARYPLPRANEAAAQKLFVHLTPEGSWSDIDYTERRRSGWPMARHLVRVQQLAAAARESTNTAFRTAAHRSLAFWIKHDFRNPNWWWNDVGVPTHMGQIGLLLDQDLSAAERTYIRGVLSRSPLGRLTGQNRSWIARNYLQRALLDNSEADFRAAQKVILDEVCISSNEGIQRDGNFHQHGHQPQLGNYGLSFFGEQAAYAHLFAGTPYAYPQEKVDILHFLAEEGYQWIIWNGQMDVSALGRQLFPGAAQQKGRSALNALKTLERDGWKRPAPPLGFKYFDCSAYAVYRTGAWMASLRASTPRIIGVETIVNEDNTKGQCMADGALFVYVTGSEYDDIFPLWSDWRMIPGVTGYLGKPVRRCEARNTMDDIVAHRTSIGGTFEFTFRREGLTAHKKWTFTPMEILCEGSGISSADTTYEVATCVEEALAAPNARIVYQKPTESCFENGGIRYLVEAPPERIRFAVEARRGDFRDFMQAMPSTPRTGKVFSLRILHGRAPHAATYRYRVIPTQRR